MKLKKVKSMWKWAKLICQMGILFGIAETIFFLIVDGWHFKPLSEWEELCDGITNILFLTGLTLASIVTIEVVEMFLSKAKDTSSGTAHDTDQDTAHEQS